MKGKDFSQPHALAKLGELFQDTGNGELRITTHAGLVVTLTLREKHPSRAAQELLARIAELEKRKKAVLSSRRDTASGKIERELIRRKLVEIPKGGLFGALRITKAGRIAAKRFAEMAPLYRRRDLREHAEVPAERKS